MKKLIHIIFVVMCVLAAVILVTLQAVLPSITDDRTYIAISDILFYLYIVTGICFIIWLPTLFFKS